MNKKELKHLIKESMIQMGIVGLRPISLREEDEVPNSKKMVISDFKGSVIKHIYFLPQTKRWYIETDRGDFSIDKQGNLKIHDHGFNTHEL